jgi:hypothetical protein
VESVYCRKTRRNKRRKTKQARKPYDIKVCNVKSGKSVSGVRSSNLPIVDVRVKDCPEDSHLEVFQCLAEFGHFLISPVSIAS